MEVEVGESGPGEFSLVFLRHPGALGERASYGSGASLRFSMLEVTKTRVVRCRGLGPRYV